MKKKKEQMQTITIAVTASEMLNALRMILRYGK